MSTFFFTVKGCGRLWVTDGIWKVAFPHCMFRVEVSVIDNKVMLYWNSSAKEYM